MLGRRTDRFSDLLLLVRLSRLGGLSDSNRLELLRLVSLLHFNFIDLCFQHSVRLLLFVVVFSLVLLLVLLMVLLLVLLLNLVINNLIFHCSLLFLKFNYYYRIINQIITITIS